MAWSGPWLIFCLSFVFSLPAISFFLSAPNSFLFYVDSGPSPLALNQLARSPGCVMGRSILLALVKGDDEIWWFVAFQQLCGYNVYSGMPTQ